MNKPGGIVLIILTLCILSLFVRNVTAMANPAAAYCEQMGYTYTIEKTPSGEKGICSPAKGEKFDEWAFYRGEVGQNYSYCVKNGYNIETINSGSTEYADCIQKTASFGKENTINMIDLMKKNGDLIIKADVSPKQQANSQIGGSNNLPASFNTPVGSGTLPSSFDWRNKDGANWMTSIKEQTGGTCWAFASVGVLEANLNIYYNNSGLDYDLAEQQLVSDGGSCCTSCGNSNGGAALDVFVYTQSTGIVDEACFPYTGCQSFNSSGFCTKEAQCNLCTNWQNRIFKIQNYKKIPFATRDDYKQALINYGPLAVSVNSDQWDSYSGGIFTENAATGANINFSDHGVDLVGWNDVGGYWIIKNSWGVYWGESGYMRLSYTNTAGKDPIGRFNDTYAVVNAYNPNPIPAYFRPYIITTNSSVARNNFFNFSVGVNCMGGACGNIFAEVESLNEMPLSKIAGTQPFYTISPQPQSCLSMQAGSSCNFTWQVNATGAAGTYQFFAIFNSSLPNEMINKTSMISIKIVCAKNPDCGMDGWTSDLTCQSNNVVKDWKTYTCNNPGTGNAACTYNDTWMVVQNCGVAGCSNGKCATIACNKNSDCGMDGWTSDLTCQSNNVVKDWKTYTCNNPGTANASCSYKDNLTLVQNCGTTYCGNFGSNYCKNGDVYYSRPCNNLGCMGGACYNTSYTNEQLVLSCGGVGCNSNTAKCNNMITISSPVNGNSYSTGSILLGLSLTQKVSTLSYQVNSGKLTTLCTNCNSYSKTIKLTDGRENLTITAKASNGVVYKQGVIFVIDTLAPTILKTSPTTTVTGKFGVEYTELNLKKVTLFYGLNSANPENSLVFNCNSGTNVWCYGNVDLSAYHGKNIYYKFTVQDNSHSTSSKAVKVIVS